ncbi:hypothetical protein [Actinoplanes sp. NPDC051494]|uniref:hypothetical protein n=1 Tax=Actinoplanes sp. NPDC051494 TaxID=3363907 RepID=UPI0037A09221
MSDIRTQAADIIEPHITGTFKRRDHAESIALSLDDSGKLLGGFDTHLNMRERVATDLGCRMDWPVAERVAAELDKVGLLANSPTT